MKTKSPRKARAPSPSSSSESEFSEHLNPKMQQAAGARARDFKLLPERGFIMEDLPSDIAKTVEKLGWERFAAHPLIHPLTSVTKEFYNGVQLLGGKVDTFSVVRRTVVPFDAFSVNQFLGLDYNGNSFHVALQETTPDRMERIKKRLAKPNIKWVTNRGGDFKLRRTDLKDSAKVWYFLLTTKLLPSTHVTYIERERLILLDLITRGKQVNVGAIVEQEIKSCWRKKAGYLFFPCLITEMCIEAGIKIAKEEEEWPMMKGIDAHTIFRCRAATDVPKKKTKKMEFSAEDSSPEGTAAEPPKNAEAPGVGSEEFQLKMECFWAFMKEFTDWQVAVYTSNFPVAQAPPPFPTWILPDQQQQHSPSPPQPPAEEGTSKRRKAPADTSEKGKKKVYESSEEEEMPAEEEKEEEEKEEEEAETEKMNISEESGREEERGKERRSKKKAEEAATVEGKRRKEEVRKKRQEEVTVEEISSGSSEEEEEPEKQGSESSVNEDRARKKEEEKKSHPASAEPKQRSNAAAPAAATRAASQPILHYTRKKRTAISLRPEPKWVAAARQKLAAQKKEEQEKKEQEK